MYACEKSVTSVTLFIINSLNGNIVGNTEVTIGNIFDHRALKRAVIVNGMAEVLEAAMLRSITPCLQKMLWVKCPSINNVTGVTGF